MPTALGEFEQLIILAILRLQDNAYGVSIRRAIEDGTGRDVSAGAVYTALGRLEGRGFVTSHIGETTPERSGKRRKYYRLEPAGASALYRSYSDVQRMAEGLISELSGLAAQDRSSRA
jgi:DNA-binding PadR family transcriptional regulator